MIIGIDGNEANIKNRVGVNKYAFEIIWGIYKLLPDNPDLIVTVYLKRKPFYDMPKENIRFKYKILSGGKVWILTRLMPDLLFDKKRPDIFFTPSHYLPPISRIPLVCSIMDLGYLKFSAQFTKYDFWQLKYWTAWSIRVSKAVLTISNATCEDIVRQYPASKKKIVVTYPGVDEYLTTKKISTIQIKEVKEKYSIVNDYVLFMGTLKPSKNIEGIIKAYKILLPKHPNIKLVIAGKKGWLYESVFNLVRELRLEKDVIFTDFVDEEDKGALILGSRAFVLPSFWEGFGLDILSAFALGVPVVASNVGSLPEIVGEAGELVDPYKIDSIAKGIENVLNLNKVNYARLMKKQKKQLTKFSWQKAASKTLEVLRKVK